MRSPSWHPDLKEIVEPALKNIRAGNGTFSAEFTPHNGFPPFDGHFPGRPILPGIALLTIVQTAMEKAFETLLEPLEFQKVKFFHPVLPEMILLLEGAAAGIKNAGSQSEDSRLILANISVRGKKDDARISSLRIVYTKKEVSQ